MQKVLRSPVPINLGKLQQLAQQPRPVVEEPTYEKLETPGLTFWLAIFGFWALSVGIANPILGTAAWAIAFAAVNYQKSYLYKKCK